MSTFIPDITDLGYTVLRTVHSLVNPYGIVGNTLSVGFIANEWFRYIWVTIQSILHPVYFGIFFTIAYTMAWFRMESIAESKRRELNTKIMMKKSITAESNPLSLKGYCDKYNGRLFDTNTPIDILNSMKSKGKTPIKAASICQPVVPPAGPGILWQSNCLTVRSNPISNVPMKQDLYADIRPIANMGIVDALKVVSMGGYAHWKDPNTRFFSKDHLVFLKFDFYDSRNFLGVYYDSKLFKRLHSMSIDEFFSGKPTDLDDKGFDFVQAESIRKLRLIDQAFFSAFCLFFCYSEVRT